MASNPRVDVSDDHQDQQGVISTGVIKEPSVDQGQTGRGTLSLQVAAISGFIRRVHSLQASCLSLCNTTRGRIPLQCLGIRTGVPPSMLALAYPTWQQEEAGTLSRVVPHKRVLKVHWIFDAFRTLNRPDGALDTVDLSIDGSIDMSEARWPQGTKEVALEGFNRPIDTITWPPGLEILWFGRPSVLGEGRGVFDMPLDEVTFPVGLREIFFGEKFNQPLKGIEWPKGLEVLSLPGFNHPIGDVKWPPGLKSLEFVSRSGIELWKTGGTVGDFDGLCGRGCFNQPLDTTLPSSLETLWLSQEFNLPLDGVAWPAGIVTLGIAFDLDCYHFSESVRWPSTVRDLFVYSKPYQGLSYPDGSNVVVLESDSYAAPSFGCELYMICMCDEERECEKFQRFSICSVGSSARSRRW